MSRRDLSPEDRKRWDDAWEAYYRRNPSMRPTPFPWFQALCVLLLLAAGCTLLGLWADWMYGDWRCAFAHCRLVK